MAMYNHMVKLFIDSCIKLDISLINDFFNTYPHLNHTPLKIEWIEDNPVSIKDRIIEILQEHQHFNPVVTVSEGICNKCEGEQKTTVFNVTYKSNPPLDTNFGFVLTTKEGVLLEIKECTQYKAYQDLLEKRLFNGKTEEEINTLKINIKNLPSL